MAVKHGGKSDIIVKKKKHLFEQVNSVLFSMFAMRQGLRLP